MHAIGSESPHRIHHSMSDATRGTLARLDRSRTALSLLNEIQSFSGRGGAEADAGAFIASSAPMLGLHSCPEAARMRIHQANLNVVEDLRSS